MFVITTRFRGLVGRPRVSQVNDNLIIQIPAEGQNLAKNLPELHVFANDHEFFPKQWVDRGDYVEAMIPASQLNSLLQEEEIIPAPTPTKLSAAILLERTTRSEKTLVNGAANIQVEHLSEVGFHPQLMIRPRARFLHDYCYAAENIVVLVDTNTSVGGFWSEGTENATQMKNVSDEILSMLRTSLATFISNRQKAGFTPSRLIQLVVQDVWEEVNKIYGGRAENENLAKTQRISILMAMMHGKSMTLGILGQMGAFVLRKDQEAQDLFDSTTHTRRNPAEAARLDAIRRNRYIYDHARPLEYAFYSWRAAPETLPDDVPDTRSAGLTFYNRAGLSHDPLIVTYLLDGDDLGVFFCTEGYLRNLVAGEADKGTIIQQTLSKLRDDYWLPKKEGAGVFLLGKAYANLYARWQGLDRASQQTLLLRQVIADGRGGVLSEEETKYIAQGTGERTLHTQMPAIAENMTMAMVRFISTA